MVARESQQHGTAQYWKVGAVLAVITALEFAVVYVESLRGVLALLLILMGLAKFALVAMYFMHLKVDTRIYTGFFLAGLILAIASFIAVFAMMAHGATKAVGLG